MGDDMLITEQTRHAYTFGVIYANGNFSSVCAKGWLVNHKTFSAISVGWFLNETIYVNLEFEDTDFCETTINTSTYNPELIRNTVLTLHQLINHAIHKRASLLYMSTWRNWW